VASTLTLQGELLLPLTILQRTTADAVQAWLRTQGVLPPQVQQCRWRIDAERQGYVLAWEVTVPEASRP
jgi:hypothetical protein